MKTPPKISSYAGPENDALVQMIFFFGGGILRFQPLIFRVLEWGSST